MGIVNEVLIVSIALTCMIFTTKALMNISESLKKIANGFSYCKNPTYPRPSRPGTSSADALRNIKPPNTGSGIK